MRHRGCFLNFACAFKEPGQSDHCSDEVSQLVRKFHFFVGCFHFLALAVVLLIHYSLVSSLASSFLASALAAGAAAGAAADGAGLAGIEAAAFLHSK